MADLIALVRELSDKLAESAAVAAMWQERARVLGDQLALAAPQSPQAGSRETDPPEPTTEPRPDPFSTPLPPHPNWRMLERWLLTVLVIVAVVGLLAWPR